MSYQVLARKWRPRFFKEMVGQEHVLKALINALDNDRLHHAYLFTGTRGVGKTTIARILAKCLNCETGVTSEPCGTCSSCQEIMDGRFVDLIEVDAASRTKVEDTRELLDNVQYAPTRGRYKVYLIDEVHMLSNHSFNALLKTLEEPPPHVKFLLATTDPQKLPATILSRCLQFSLKNMTPERIVHHLTHVLGEEKVQFQEPALWLLARSADGSMRDAMSLTDQAIAYGSGEIRETDVRMMLGSIDRTIVFDLLEALAIPDAAKLLSVIAHFAENAPDYEAALDALLMTLHRLAIAQAVPQAIDNSEGDQAKLEDLATKFTAEDIQFYYQMGLMGRKDLPLSPDPRGGFEMAMLRMLAFRPQGVVSAPSEPLPSSGKYEPPVSASSVAPSPAISAPTPSPVSETDVKKPKAAESSTVNPSDSAAIALDDNKPEPAQEVQSQLVEPADTKPVETVQPSSIEELEVRPPSDEPLDSQASQDAARLLAQQEVDEFDGPSFIDEVVEQQQKVVEKKTESVEPRQETVEQKTEVVLETQAPKLAEQPSARTILEQAVPAPQVQQAPIAPKQTEKQKQAEQAKQQRHEEQVKAAPTLAELSMETWADLVPALPIAGVTKSIAMNCALLSLNGQTLTLVLNESYGTLYSDIQRERIEQGISEFYNTKMVLEVDKGEVHYETPAQKQARIEAEKQQEAENIIANDPKVAMLVQAFSAQVLPNSISPNE